MLFILDKGFQVKINEDEVVAKPTRLIFTKTENTQGTDRAIRPYIYQTESDGVKVFFECRIYNKYTISRRRKSGTR